MIKTIEDQMRFAIHYDKDASNDLNRIIKVQDIRNNVLIFENIPPPRFVLDNHLFCNGAGKFV